MFRLKLEPPAPLRSLAELFALAQELEQEAAARYAELASRMRALQLPQVAATFSQLAEEERRHADQVEDWSRRSTDQPPDPARIRWQPPETFDEAEAGRLGTSRLASAYRALSMAVRNEERAFALWVHIAAQAEQADIRAAAERMAKEELGHAALLRQARRRAFHAERAGAAAAGPAPLQRALRAERALGPLLAALAATARAAPARHATLHRLAETTAAMAEEAASLTAAAAEPAAPDPTVPPEALLLAEQALDAYLDAADAAAEEDRLHRLQALAERAIARLALLRDLASTA